ncbi:MAG: hypothetical protein GX254_11365 [Clostridiales bacterium]|jgi:hypothetical protein|nr:hypothetical protein [Clostridiales bacterium]
MAFYKQQCIHCGQLIDSDARVCNKCGSPSPFYYSCPTCLLEINIGDAACSGCGRPLYITCPFCSGVTFVHANCEKCGKSLMVQCQNHRCNQPQFFENQKCTACGKKIRSTLSK